MNASSEMVMIFAQNHHKTKSERFYKYISIDRGSTKYAIEKLFIETSESALKRLCYKTPAQQKHGDQAQKS